MSEEQLINEFKGVFQRLTLILEDQKKLYDKILERQLEKDKREEKVIAKEVVIPANDSKEFDSVNNPHFNRARVFLDAGFTPAHSGGLTVELHYKKSKIGDVLKVISSNGACGQASEPIDVAQLSGFYFAVKNHDVSNSTTVKNFRIVLYNELLTFNNQM